MKVCSCCHRELSDDNFYKHSKRGYQSRCKDCKKIEQHNDTLKTYVSKETRVMAWCKATLRRHKVNGFKINITPEELFNYAIKVEFCEYTGDKLDWFVRDKFINNSPTLDRLNNESEIRLDNIRIITHLMNVMKQTLTFKEYINHCKLMVTKFGDETDET